MYNAKYWTMERRVIYWDIISYYGYLPATFIYGDVTLGFLKTSKEDFGDKFWAEDAPNGGKVQKMSMGLAILYSPFFFMAHITAKLLHYEADGFSVPYRIFLLLSSVFYLVVGLHFLRKLLLRYFSEMVTSITLFSIVIGTNLFYYVAYEGPMSHCYSFAAFAVLAYLTVKWYESPTYKLTIFIGLLLGLIILIRPTNIVVLFFFALFNIQSMKDLGLRIRFFLTSPHTLIFAACIFLVWLPQLIYWKTVTGQWLFYSYIKGGLYFDNPHIINGLLSYRKGWLLYTPLMAFALVGIIFLRKQLKAFFLPVLVFTLINIYTILSWWCWWYGGCLGMRPFIDSYSILAIPLAALLTWILGQKTILKTAGISLIVLFTIYGRFVTKQYCNGAIHWDSMSRAAFWDSFGHAHPSANFEKLLLPPDYDKAIEGKEVNVE